MRYDPYLGYLAPIRWDRVRQAYYYDDPDYSIDQLPINSDEMDSLKMDFHTSDTPAGAHHCKLMFYPINSIFPDDPQIMAYGMTPWIWL